MGKTHAQCFCQLISSLRVRWRIFCVLHCWFGLLYSLRTCWQICQVSSTQKTKCLFLYLPMWGKYFPVLKPEVGFYFHESRCECSNQTSRLSYYSCLRFLDADQSLLPRGTICQSFSFIDWQVHTAAKKKKKHSPPLQSCSNWHHQG